MFSLNFFVGLMFLFLSPVVGMAAGVIVWFLMLLCTYPLTRWDPFSSAKLADITGLLTTFSVVTMTLAVAARSVWMMWA